MGKSLLGILILHFNVLWQAGTNLRNLCHLWSILRQMYTPSL